jgi:hypothetical protein
MRMRERPILFSAPMVRALLAGTKTQTRRIVKPGRAQQWLSKDLLHRSPKAEFVPNLGVFKHPSGGPLTCITPPYGVPGDLLWVREAHALHERFSDVVRVAYAASLPGSWTEATAEFPAHKATGLKIKPFQEGFRPSIHMPRWASRITLRITDVRVERLNEISEADAIAEGIDRVANNYGNGPGYCDYLLPDVRDTAEWYNDPRNSYRSLWQTIHGEDSWPSNPWVWAVNFERVLP